MIRSHSLLAMTGDGQFPSHGLTRVAGRYGRLAALASGFVGALALAVATDDVYLQRVQIGAQVWPPLEWS